MFDPRGIGGRRASRGERRWRGIAKIKTSDVNDLVTFVVQVCSLYPQFSEMLLNELPKQIPTKKSEKIENATKLKMDLK